MMLLIILRMFRQLNKAAAPLAPIIHVFHQWHLQLQSVFSKRYVKGAYGGDTTSGIWKLSAPDQSGLPGVSRGLGFKSSQF